MNKISIIAPINDTSYGIVSQNICLTLKKFGVDVLLYPIQDGIYCNDNREIFYRMVESGRFFDENAPCIRIFHQNSMHQWVPCSRRVGLPIFELDTFIPLEKHHLAYPDALFVCSDWASAVVKSNFLSKAPDPAAIAVWDKINSHTHVVPLGVDPDIFSPKPIQAGPTRFLNIGKLEKRKGLDILVRAFKEEFNKSENVQLFLCCDNPFLNNEQKEKWRKLLMIDSRIKLVPRQQSVRDIVDLINLCDCCVSPSKAEGWNMPALEALSCGRHLIITDYSAHQMYANKENSYLIPIKRLEPAYDDIWPVFYGQGNWAKIDDLAYEHLKAGMRWYHEKKQSGDLSLNDAGIETAKRLSWDNTAQKILENV